MNHARKTKNITHKHQIISQDYKSIPLPPSSQLDTLARSERDNEELSEERRCAKWQMVTLLSGGPVAVRVTRSKPPPPPRWLQGAAQCAASHVRAALFVSTYMFMCRSQRSAAPLVVQRDSLLTLKSTCVLFMPAHAVSAFVLIKRLKKHCRPLGFQVWNHARPSWKAYMWSVF